MLCVVKNFPALCHLFHRSLTRLGVGKPGLLFSFGPFRVVGNSCVSIEMEICYDHLFYSQGVFLGFQLAIAKQCMYSHHTAVKPMASIMQATRSSLVTGRQPKCWEGAVTRPEGGPTRLPNTQFCGLDHVSQDPLPFIYTRANFKHVLQTCLSSCDLHALLLSSHAFERGIHLILRNIRSP